MIFHTEYRSPLNRDGGAILHGSGEQAQCCGLIRKTDPPLSATGRPILKHDELKLLQDGAGSHIRVQPPSVGLPSV